MDKGTFARYKFKPSDVINGMKSKVRELQEENALLKKDIADLRGEETDGTADTDD